MTREEAIEVLRKSRPGADPRRCGLELCTAVDMAIAALREQEERSKGCEHCLSEINKDMMLAHGFAHCTDCGRRLEDT